MRSDDVHSAMRFVVGCVLVFVVLALVDQIRLFTSLFSHRLQDPRAAFVPQRKQQAHKQQAHLDIETRLKKMHAFRLVAESNQDLRCEERGSPWSYVCSFVPTPTTSTARLRFGVMVDSKGMVRELSSLSPEGTVLAPPRNRTARR